jgi:hypothetical protein
LEDVNWIDSDKLEKTGGKIGFPDQTTEKGQHFKNLSWVPPEFESV